MQFRLTVHPQELHPINLFFLTSASRQRGRDAEAPCRCQDEDGRSCEAVAILRMKQTRLNEGVREK